MQVLSWNCPVACGNAPHRRDRAHRQPAGCVHRLSGDGTCELERALRERLKELNCLYGISRLVEEHPCGQEPILQGIVDLLPPSWQYPEICRARLTLYDQCYTTADFRESPWRQAAAIRAQGKAAGTVEVFYLEPMPEMAEGPFLREERCLIDAVAERTGKIVEHFQVQQQLKVDRAALQEANAALRRVLAQIEEEKAEIHRSIEANVQKILLPVLQALASEIPEQQKQYVSLLSKHLEDLAAPFTRKVSKACAKLTPVEIEICNMIGNGMTTKEIARFRRVSPATVSKQRERIRRKLGISGTEDNLATHLHALAAREEW